MPTSYPIRAVVKLTGIEPDTLRAWERRYAAVTPEHSDRGRVYSEAQVHRLLLLRDVVAAGHSIGRVAGLPDRSLRGLLEGGRALLLPETQSAHPETGEYPDFLKPLLQRVEQFDSCGAELELNRVATSCGGAREVVHSVALPLMRITGERWHQGVFTVAQEHLVTSLLTNLLSTFLRIYPNTTASSRIVFATPEGEFHVFGVLAAAVLAASGGLGTVFLGANLPAQELVQATRHAKASTVLFGLCGVRTLSLPGDLKFISNKLKARANLWAGGGNEEMNHVAVRAGWKVLPSFQELEQQLVLLGARF